VTYSIHECCVSCDEWSDVSYSHTGYPCVLPAAGSVPDTEGGDGGAAATDQAWGVCPPGGDTWPQWVLVTGQKLHLIYYD